MKRPLALITGMTGFAGSYLAEELLANGYRVAGTRMQGESKRNLELIEGDLSLLTLDILNAKRCIQVVKDVQPDYLFHLAAMASVGKSYTLERETYKVNFEGTLNMLEASRESRSLKKFIFISSPDCFGRFSPKNKTLTEQQPLAPVSPYGISKAAAEHLCRYFVKQYRLPVAIARAFNHSGPRQSDSFVIPSFARQIALIESGRQKPVIQVGDLSARRDLSDVRDIVLGYRSVAERGEIDHVYHLCSGRAVTIQHLLDSLLKMSEKKITVHVDKSRLRKAEIPVLRGSGRKAGKQLGFSLRYSLKRTLEDTLRYWRVEAGAA
jgi:GDP-4-dehydro-6-deoxy-D-mannose reductase